MTRIGLIVPSSNTTMESEFHNMLPESCSVHTARIRLREITVEQLALMEERIEDAAVKLGDAEVGVIGYGCTSGSLYKGPGHDKRIEERIARATGIPAVATAGAVINALKALDVKKVSVVTPYTNQINELEEKFLSSSGFQVVDLKGLGIKENLKIGRLDSKVAYRLVMGLEYADADGIFMSCTNFPTAAIVGNLEHTTQKSVVSSNTATLWAMLKECDVATKIEGFGTLLETI